jgi:Flp pilus assembly protein TadG
MFTFMRRVRQREEGAAIVEFALVAPLLVLLLFGIIQFGRVFNAKVTYTHAAREAVRVVAVTGDATAAETAASNASQDLNPATLTVVIDDCSDGEATANVSAPFELEIPFFGNPTLDIGGSATMTCET